MPEAPDDALQAVERVLRSRRSTRAFLQRDVPPGLLREVLALASTAPSNSNTQPWHVHAVAAGAKDRLSRALEAAFLRNDAPPPAHFPEALPPAVQALQNDFAERYYKALGIDRADRAARERQTQRNYAFFGAPVGLIFTIDRSLRPHSWLDLGLFVQNTMLAACAHGLATCPQVSFARFHHVIARELSLADHELTVCGMSLGYPDPAAPVNLFPISRRPVADFLRVHGFD